MNKLNNNINFLKNIIQKRETYIRFSPIWTGIMWIMYIIYYFFSDEICYISWPIDFFFCIEQALFIFIWLLWIVIVTILSLINSKNKKEELLPKSIKYIIVNLMYIWITCSVVWFIVFLSSPLLIFPISFLFYWLLIIVSRFCIPKSIQYFWFVIFLCWILLLWPLSQYTKEIILVIFWFGHLIIAKLLKIDNDKNG